MALTKNATSGKWEGSVGSITAAGTYSTELETAGTYVDANIIVSATVGAAELQSVEGNAPTATAGLANNGTYLTDTNTGYKITATADAAATSKAGVDAVKTAGWVPANGSVTVTTPKATQATASKYIIAGALSNATGGAVTATVGLADTTYLTTDSTAGYGPITATADASRTAVTVGVGTAGWIPTTASKTSAAASATQDSVTKYVKKGALKSNSGSAGATGTGVTLGTKTTTQPTSGKYITVTGSGSVGVQTAGWLTTDDSKSSNTATAYYPVTSATLNNTATSGQSYTEIDGATNSNVIIPSGGYLYINGGYIDNTKISLASLVPDGATIAETATGKSDMMRGISAYDKDGKLIAGSMPDAVLSVANGGSKVTPVIKASTTSGKVSTATVGTLTTTQPASGTYYVAVDTSAIDASTTATATVTTTGYAIKGTTTASGTITRGANAAAIAYIPITKATYSNGTASITGPTYDSTNDNFTVSSSGNATVNQQGHTDAKGTSTGTVSGSKTLSKIVATVSGSVKPVIAKATVATGVTDASNGAATTTAPSSGVYVAVSSAAKSTAATVSVGTAGYGTSANHGISGTVGASASDTTYVPIKTTTASAKTAANATAAGTSITLGTATTTKPSSGRYITVTPSAGATTVASAGWISAGDTSTGAAAAKYYTVASSTHSIEANGTATTTNATLTNTQAATGTLNSATITPVTYTSTTAVGANYVRVRSTAAQSTAGSASIPIKCTSTAGYTDGEEKTYTASSNVGVTSKTGDIYFKVYNGEVVTA